MSDTKLFVCCHRRTTVPEHPLLVPIQVGASLAEEKYPGFLSDDAGENISDKNRSYCELTALYWAWKNCSADYCGFFHYRRYLWPGEGVKGPYIICGEPSPGTLARLRYDGFASLIERYDLIMPRSEDMCVPVREHYSGAPFHHGKDLTLMEAILRERCPEYMDAAESYLSGSLQYFGNLCIMRRETLDSYCRWLFPLLEEFDRRADTAGYSAQERRVDGYLAERLLGIYYIHRRDRLRTVELPRVHFEPNGIRRLGKRVVNAILPPGSRHRAAVKRMKNGE